MQTRSSSRLISDQSSNPTSSTNPNPKGRNCRRSKQLIENSNLEEQSHPIVAMTDNRTMAELLRAPTEGYAKAIVVPPILAEQFELKHSLINMMTTDQFFRLEKDNPHDHICWFNKITSTIKYKDVPSSAIKLMLFPFSLAGAARRTTNLHNEISNFQQRFDESFHEAWDRYKDLLRACPHHGFTEFHQLDTFYNALNPADQDSLNAVVGGNLLERSTQDVLTIIENKSKVRNSRSKPIASQVKACDVNSNSLEIAKLTHAVNQQTNAVTTPMTAILKQFQANPPPASVKAVEETCITCGAAVNYNQGNPGYRPLEETFTGPDLAEYTIKVPPPPAKKYKPPSQKEFVVHQRDPRHMNIPYPSRMLKQKQQEKDEVQIQKFWQMFKQLHINITLADALIPVILKKLPEKLGDPGKFLIPCGFSELKCKALADLGVSINLIPLSVWKKLGLPELIPTRMTLELANHAICIPAGIARDVFIPVSKFTFPTDFVIVDYESDPRVPLILGRPFYGLLKESINLINVFNNSSEEFLEDLFPYQPSGNPTFLLHPELTSLEVNSDIFDSEGCNVLSEKWLDLDSTKDLHPSPRDNPLSSSTTYPLLEEFADELPMEYDDNLQFDIEIVHIWITFLESDVENIYNDPFDSKGEKIKESKLLIDELDLPYDFHPPLEYDSSISPDFSKVDAFPSTNNEDKIFNPGILIQEKPFEIINSVVQDKKLAISNASLVFEDFDPTFYEPLFFKEVPMSKMLLPFLSKNEEKVFRRGIHTSEKVHSYFIPELSHQGYKVFKINQIFKSLMKIFLFYCGKDTHILAIHHHHFYPLDQLKYGGIGSSSVT
uniref:Reverse transcriptase domain-containing protein n=1 Tax=Tanacetum cinerariifolium TaxID=118510 RepID=A0A6L2JIQ4_TANCI|nr:reverse transcriptase domain-containing protein [Tanacetum cinerariifolium]